MDAIRKRLTYEQRVAIGKALQAGERIFLAVTYMDALSKVIAFFLRHLPIRMQTIALTGVNPIGNMDYKPKRILMTAGTISLLYRLWASQKEQETVAWIEAEARPGDVLYDIGANVGAYSLIAWAASGGQTKVYAFEPSFSTFESLCRNIFLNGAQGRIIPFSMALSDRTALMDLQFRDLNPGSAMHRLSSRTEPESPDGNGLRQPILSYTLDDFIAQFDLDLPDLIKLDVDGHELRVLKGAEKTLSQPTTRSVLVEMNTAEPEQMSQIEEWLSAKGFRTMSKHRHGDSSFYNYIFHREAPAE